MARATSTLDDDDDIAALHDVEDKPFADAKTFVLTRYLDNSHT